MLALSRASTHPPRRRHGGRATRPWRLNRSLRTTRRQPSSAAAHVRATNAAERGEGSAERNEGRANGSGERRKTSGPNEGLTALAANQAAAGAHPGETKQHPCKPIIASLRRTKLDSRARSAAVGARPSANSRRERRAPARSGGQHGLRLGCCVPNPATKWGRVVREFAKGGGRRPPCKPRGSVPCARLHTTSVQEASSWCKTDIVTGK